MYSIIFSCVFIIIYAIPVKVDGIQYTVHLYVITCYQRYKKIVSSTITLLLHCSTARSKQSPGCRGKNNETASRTINRWWHFYFFVERKIIGLNGKVLFAILTIFNLGFSFS